MKMIDINLKPDDRALRQFGLVALVFFGALGGFIYWKKGLFGFDFPDAAPTVAYVLWGVAALSGLFALVAPKANKPLYVTLVIVSFPIGFVLSYVIMSFLFFVLITGVALVFKLVGRDVMERKYDRNASSYWSRREGPEPAAARYFKQF